MEVLSNLSLPFVFEYPATPCAPLLLLSLLCLASVIQFFFFQSPGTPSLPHPHYLVEATAGGTTPGVVHLLC